MRIKGYTPKDLEGLDETIVQIEVWWDSNITLWTVQSKNEAGDQIGDCEYAGHKVDAVKIARRIEEWTEAKVIIGTRRG